METKQQGDDQYTENIPEKIKFAYFHDKEADLPVGKSN